MTSSEAGRQRQADELMSSPRRHRAVHRRARAGAPGAQRAQIPALEAVHPIIRSAVIVALAIALTVIGCTSQTTDQGRSPGMQIRNMTAGQVVVSYRLMVEGREQTETVAELRPGEILSVTNLHTFEGRCLRGVLVATQTGREIATLPRPCEGTVWRIASTTDSDSPGSPSP